MPVLARSRAMLGCALIALFAACGALAACTDKGVVGNVAPLSPAKCATDMECSASERCDHDTGECVPCSGGQCEPSEETDPCDQPDAQCPECTANADCSDPTPFCVAQSCRACRRNDDCIEGDCVAGVCQDHETDDNSGASDDTPSNAGAGSGSMDDDSAGSSSMNDGRDDGL